MTRLQLDLGRAPYVLYGVKYIDLVSLCDNGSVDPFLASPSRLTRIVLQLPVLPMFRMGYVYGPSIPCRS